MNSSTKSLMEERIALLGLRSCPIIPTLPVLRLDTGRSLPPTCVLRVGIKTPFQTVRADFPHTAYRSSSHAACTSPG